MSVVLVTPYLIKNVTSVLSSSDSNLLSLTTLDTPTFTYTMSSARATGTVTFYANGVSFGTASVSNNAAISTASIITIGSQNVTAAYGGDSEYPPITAGSSNSISVSVIYYSFLSLESSTYSIITGSSVTLTATLSFFGITAPNAALSGKTITFYDNGVSKGTGTTNTSGIASLVTTTLGTGTRTVSANYPASATSTASSDSITVSVDALVAATTTNQTTSTSWTVPAAVYSVSILAIGAGGDGDRAGGTGGAAACTNNYPVTPGGVITITVGSTSSATYGGVTIVSAGQGASYFGDRGGAGGKGGNGQVDEYTGSIPYQYVVTGGGGGAAGGLSGNDEYTGAGLNVSINGGVTIQAPYSNAGGTGQGAGGGSASWTTAGVAARTNGGSGGNGSGCLVTGYSGYGWGAGAPGTGSGTQRPTYPTPRAGGPGIIAIKYGNNPSTPTW